ncbi:unnamed protein product [Rhizophagus irregularis]|uniref:Uncharacterized protein n=1 Tax=Rhizophagus irregularis TaxID=588596 RepID=A0A915ZDR1_9GLOM|nr:unnamed protein product [Rhizophagus irregularis]
MVAPRRAGREAMAAGQTGEIAARHQGPPGDEFEIAGELRPVRRFEIDVLAHRDHAQFAKGGLHIGRGEIERVERVGLDHHGQVMLAKAGSARRDIVLGRCQLVTLAQRLIIGGLHPAQSEVHAIKRCLAIDKGEALAQHHFGGKPQQIVEHAGHGLRRIILDRHHRGEATRRIASGREFEGVGPEADPAIGQILAEIAARLHHPPQITTIEQCQKFERFGTASGRTGIAGEQARAIGFERSKQDVARGVERDQIAHPPRVTLRASAPAHQILQHPDPPRQRTPHQRDEQVVDVEFPAGQLGAPGGVQRLAEGIGKGPFEHRLHFAADDMMIQREACIGDAAQHRVAQRLAVIQFLRIRRFERETRQPDDLHHPPVAQLDRRIVERAGIRQIRARRAFTREARGLVNRGGARQHRSGTVRVATPIGVVAPARALRELGHPQIEEARLAQTREISAQMDDERQQQHQKRFAEEKRLHRDDGVEHEEAVGDAREHLRAGQRAEHRIAGERRVHSPGPVAADLIPATIAAAPNTMKQPRMTVAPRRQSMRPVSIPSPVAPTAITASEVATAPSRVPCTQSTAETITPDPDGSSEADWACAMVLHSRPRPAATVRARIGVRRSDIIDHSSA